MTGYEPDANAPNTPAVEADGTATDRIVGLAFGKYVVTAAESRVTTQKTVQEPDASAQAEADPEAEAGV